MSDQKNHLHNNIGWGLKAKAFDLADTLQCLCVESYLRHGLPLGGIVLAGVDAVIPAALHHVEDGLHGNVELGGPADLQLTRRLLQKHQLFPRLQRDS